jgi:hypothetical protein
VGLIRQDFTTISHRLPAFLKASLSFKSALSSLYFIFNSISFMSSTMMDKAICLLLRFEELIVTHLMNDIKRLMHSVFCLRGLICFHRVTYSVCHMLKIFCTQTQPLFFLVEFRYRSSPWPPL